MIGESHKASRELIENLSFCVFDLETTGGNHKNDKIIEIGLVKIEKLKITNERSYLIRPDIRIPDFIQKLTNISSKDVENSPRIEEVIHEIVDFMGNSILVAHNISFDIPFFNSVLERQGLPTLPNNGLCTNLMTRYMIPDLLNTNLNSMCKIFGIKHPNAHRALDDAKATAELLLKYLEIFINKDINKINHLYYPRNRYELDRTNCKKESGHQAVIDKISSQKMAYLLSLKGKEGIILDVIPGNNPKKEIPYLESRLKRLPWENATIHLFGSLFEALIQFSLPFPKLTQEARHETLAFLSGCHLNSNIIPKVTSTKDNNTLIVPGLGDFLIAKHLIPEQYVIYPIAGATPKSQLIFRYPAHNKKLLQFINSKSTRLSADKLKKASFPPPLRDFLVAYLLKCKQENLGPYIFEKELLRQSPELFTENLENYFKQNTSQSQYPNEYI